MLSILSPAKTLDYETAPTTKKSTQPLFVDQAASLVETARQLDPTDIRALMGVSENIATLNHQRFMNWQPDFSLDNAKQSVLAFKGDVYTGLQAESLTKDELTFAQKHLRILSGLYGLLRPLDLMQPYRLEMGTRLATQRGSNLYQFWGRKVTDNLNKALAEQSSKVLINLASNEYYQVIHPEGIDGRILTINFKEQRNGQYRFVSFAAKKARGLMERYMIDNRITRPAQLRQFDIDGYAINDALSSDDEWIFTR